MTKLSVAECIQVVIYFFTENLSSLLSLSLLLFSLLLMLIQVSSMVNIDGPETLVTRDLLGEFSKSRNNNNQKKDHIEMEKINIGNPLQPRRSLDTFLIDHHDLKRTSRKSHFPDSPLSSSSPSSINNNHPNNNLNSDNKNPIVKPFLEESCSLELKLNPSTITSRLGLGSVCPVNIPMPCSFDEKTSVVCTLDKVKSALERAERSMEISFKKRSLGSQEEGRAIVSNKGGIMFAAGCPSCLLYVIASRDDPKCPRCNYYFLPNSDVSVKKPRIDLNDVGFGSLRYGANEIN